MSRETLNVVAMKSRKARVRETWFVVTICRRGKCNEDVDSLVAIFWFFEPVPLQKEKEENGNRIYDSAIVEQRFISLGKNGVRTLKGKMSRWKCLDEPRDATNTLAKRHFARDC